MGGVPDGVDAGEEGECVRLVGLADAGAAAVQGDIGAAGDLVGGNTVL